MHVLHRVECTFAHVVDVVRSFVSASPEDSLKAPTHSQL